MKKGFTLVELLAVIVILSALAVLITPKIVKTLREAEDNVKKESANELLKAAEYKATNLDLTNSSDLIIDFTQKINVNKLEYIGEVPEKGKITIMADGHVAMAVKLGDKCYKKEFDEKELSILEYDEGTCVNEETE